MGSGSLRTLGWKKKEYLALTLIMLLAVFLRFYQLGAIPAGIDGDQGADGFGAKRILAGEEYPIFLSNRWGAPSMHTYLVASSFALWGTSLWAIRFASAVVGVLTIPVLFWLAKELFPTAEDSPSLVAILSAFFVATSYWHIIFSRAGQAATLPLFSTAAMYFLWRGVRSERRWPFLVAGVLLGAALYGYRAVRFLPIFLIILFGHWVLSDGAFRQRHLRNVALLILVAAAVCTPLAAYAALHPEVFFAREQHVFVFNPELGSGNPVGDFATALADTLGMFNLKGDPAFRWNPGRRPVLDPISSACFFIGIGIALWKWKGRSYGFVLLWLLVMALPGAFALEHLPAFNRGIGALPAVCLLSAIGVGSFKYWLENKVSWRGAHAVSRVALPFVLVSTTLLSCRDYFVPWWERITKGEIMGRTYMEAAAIMNATQIPKGVWILPATSLRPRELPFYEVSFLYNGPEPEFTIYADEETGPTDLAEVCEGRELAAVVNWRWYVLEEAYTSWDSDPKGLIDFLLRKYGHHTGQERHESFDLVTYELPTSPNFSIASSFEPSDLDFDHELRLAGTAFGGSSLNSTSTPEDVERRLLPSGKEAWVVLQWQAINPPSKNYKVAVYLLDGRGRPVGQVDKLLLSNDLRPTSGWAKDQLEIDYYSLPSLPATPPGEYHIWVAVYDPETMERLTVFDEREGITKTSVAVGTLQVIKPLEPPQVEPFEQLSGTEGDIAPGMRLLGFDLPARVVGPGDTVSITLFWRALEDIAADYLLSLQLKDADGRTQMEQKGRPVDGTYPTSRWEKGEVLRDWHDLTLAATAPQGLYDIVIAIIEGDELRGQASLGQLEVTGRPRLFVLPDVQYPLEARLGHAIQFLGYDLDAYEFRPGETIHLTLYWRTLAEMKTSYTVFTHLLDSEDRVWGQKDGIPAQGEAPTTSWVEGEIIRDDYEIAVDPQVPPGEYTIEIGMYDAGTGQRLAIFDPQGALQGDRILLAGIRSVAGE